jgi:hypothetical protein
MMPIKKLILIDVAHSSLCNQFKMENILDCSFIDSQDSDISSSTRELKILSGDPDTFYDDLGLIIDDKIFKDSTERDRTIIEYPKNFLPRDDREIVFEAVMSSKQFFGTKNSVPRIPTVFLSRIENIKEDPRLCCGTFLISDVYNGMKYGFVSTNEIIYVYYGRDKTENCDEANFVSLIPVSHRGNKYENDREGVLNDFRKFSIGFSKRDYWHVRWCIDGECCYSNDNIGYRVDYEYICFEGGGVSHRTKVENLRMHITHSAFLDFQLPKNIHQNYISTDRSGKYTINRNCSGLVQLYDEGRYKEIRQNFFGEYESIKLKISFGCTFEESNIDDKFRTFNQGVVTRIISLKVFYSPPGSNCRCGNLASSLSYTSNDLSYTSNNLSYTSKNLPCTSEDLPRTSDDLPCTSDDLPCTLDDLHLSINKNRQKVKMSYSDLTSDSTWESSTNGNTDYDDEIVLEKSEKIILDSILETSERLDDFSNISSYLGDNFSSLESLSKKSHDHCWQCERKCESVCCSGNCGSRSCHRQRKKADNMNCSRKVAKTKMKKSRNYYQD